MSQLTDTDRHVIANIRRISEAMGPGGSAKDVRNALRASGLATTMAAASDESRDPYGIAATILCVDAMELVGLVRRLTGEDL